MPTVSGEERRIPHVYSSDEETHSTMRKTHKRADSTSDWLPDIILDQPLDILCMSRVEMSIGFLCLFIALGAYLTLDQILEAVSIGG
ncbi:hypothetical protein ACHWQZ_G001296 [Mnemiopsis leidyi]